MDLKRYLAEKRKIIEDRLSEAFPPAEGPISEVIKAMNYSLMAGGKRLRPILCIAGSETVGGSGNDVLPVACALEMIHTYSLIHDDLPAMDNDDLRRGKPTNHKVFGEAVAVLAGDGLLTEAFNIMTKTSLTNEMPAGTFQRVVSLIATAAGFQGMVGGQAVDIQMEGSEVDRYLVDFIHTHKTGALISASVSSGAIIGGGSDEQVEALTAYGDRIGLAFQIADDILDIEGDSSIMGKGAGGDEERGKNTYPSIYGLKQSKEILRDMISEAVSSLDQFDGKADPLRQIAGYIIERNR